MVERWGVGLSDFTGETTISGSASISGNIVEISGELAVSGAVGIVNDFIYRTQMLVITGSSGGQALGSGLTTSGYTVHGVTIKIPPVKVSGTTNYGLVYNSGLTTPYVYIGGYSGDAPYPGSGAVISAKGYVMAPGDSIKLGVKSLSYIYATSETSGSALSYVVEMR